MTEGVDIKLHGRAIHTVFDLLGTKEDDITYSVGWGLARSEGFSYALLDEIFDGEVGTLSAVLLQQSEAGYGRTDIELQTQGEHLSSKPNAAGTFLNSNSSRPTPSV